MLGCLTGWLAICLCALKRPGKNLNAAFTSVSDMINECHEGLDIVYIIYIYMHMVLNVHRNHQAYIKDGAIQIISSPSLTATHIAYASTNKTKII